MLTTAGHNGVTDLAPRAQEQLNLQAGRAVLGRALGRIVATPAGLPDRSRYELAPAAIAYGAPEAAGGVGPVLRRRWAEYLVLLATGAFIPVEVRELMLSVTVVKLAALAVNVAIMVHLVWRTRLFLERPGGPDAEAPDG